MHQLTLKQYDLSGSLKQQQCDPLDFKCTSYCTICHCTNFSNIMQCKLTASNVKKDRFCLTMETTVTSQIRMMMVVMKMMVMAMMVMTMMVMVFVIYNFSFSKLPN